MADQLVPTVKTPVTPVGFARALLKVWPEATREACGVLYAQYAVETGAGAACWNWNLGNVKYTRGWGGDYVALVRNREYDEKTQSYYETAKADPSSWFRAYPSFEAGMRAFVLSKTTGQWKSTKPFIERGDHAGYSAELKRLRYYTAPLDAYQAGMRTWFGRWMKMGAWEEAVEPGETMPPPPPSSAPVTLESPRRDPTRAPGFSNLDYDPDAPPDDVA